MTGVDNTGPAEADSGFAGYVPTTTDPGTSLLIATAVICILLNAILPCVVAIGNHRNKKRRKLASQVNSWAVDAVPKTTADLRPYTDEERSMHASVSPTTNNNYNSNILKLPTGDTRSQVILQAGAPSVVSVAQRSVASAHTMTTSVANHSIATGGVYGMRSRKQYRFRKALEQRAIQDEMGVPTHSFFRFESATARAATTDGGDDDEDDNQSFLSKMDTDEVSVKTFSIDTKHKEFLPKEFQEDDDEDSLLPTCSGPLAWWKLKWVLAYFDRIVALAEWDFEMRKIIKLTLPFAIQAISSGLIDVVTVAVIGNFVGTKSASAYVITGMLIGLTDGFLGGFWGALTSLCSQAIGTKHNKLCGQYVQMAILLYVFLSIPCMLIWWNKIEAAILWFGFDEETALIGRDYARVALFSYLVGGISETLHGLLDVIDLANYSTVMVVSEDLVGLVIVLQVAIFGTPKLYHIGLVHLGIGILSLVLNISVITWKQWFAPYMSGLVGSLSLTNHAAVWLMCKTAATLSMSYLMMDAEWELLTFLASFLGPAEVAAWAIIGSLWGSIEALTEAIGDAAEVRCAFLLGCGRPKLAQVSAYKSILMATIVSFLVTSILYTMGEDVATWLTPDPILQQIIIDLLPLFGIGNVTLTIGTLSWTLLGAQGRYPLATKVAFGGSWLITIPLAAISSVALNLSLQGQTAAVVVGYMATGTVNAYFLFLSDWKSLSRAILINHGETPGEAPVDDSTGETPRELSIFSSDGASISLTNDSIRSHIELEKHIGGDQDFVKTP